MDIIICLPSVPLIILSILRHNSYQKNPRINKFYAYAYNSIILCFKFTTKNCESKILSK